MTELQIDVLCTIQYLSNDRRSKSLPSLTSIGVFLRGSAKSKRKSFMKKYDTYGKYPKITNEEIESILDYLCKQGFKQYNN